MTKEKKFDLDGFYRSRQELAGEINSPYAHRQLSEIRKQVQEAKLSAINTKQNKNTSEKEVKGVK